MLPSRKVNRLRSYDYTSNGAYFITICTHQHTCILGKIAGRGGQWPPAPVQVNLSEYGKVVKDAIENIPRYYPHVAVDHYVIMPNHLHLLLMITAPQSGRPMTAPTVSGMVNQLKGYVSKRIGHSIWQKSFHDHVIRSEAAYQKIWEYIDTNPLKWADDCYYTNEQELTAHQNEV